MQKELALFWLFVQAIFADWIGWMSGVAGLALTIGAHFMSEFASPFWFWVVGAIAFLFACYRAWRREYGWALTAEQKAWLLRVIRDGERRLDAFQDHTRDDVLTLTRTGDLIEWHRETMDAIRKDYPKQWVHFSDIGSIESKGTDGMDSQAELLLERLRDLAHDFSMR